jgi:UDP-N-acetylglucosamine 2-epimerase (non-hydrolysing)
MYTITNFLPHDQAVNYQAEILSYDDSCWNRYDNPFEKKWSCKHKDLCAKIFSDAFKTDLENKFGPLEVDEHRHFWGIHKFENGDFLDLHLDAGVHPVLKLKKHVTVGLYLSKNWSSSKNGGDLEFWSPTDLMYKVPSEFNTLVVFENTLNSWHGSPTPVVCSKDETRIFVTVSYLSKMSPVSTKERAQFLVPKNNYMKKILSEQRSSFKNMYTWNKKIVVTITGIRPDFIRMSEIFKRLDEDFFHVLIHTGQHYDVNLSDVFFHERKPDFVLETGRSSKSHYEQLSYLSTEIPKLFKDNGIHPDLIVFLGDSNTVAVSLPLKKDGYKICHIEAGMRSGDRRMLEEINRTVCDHCSDLFFVYHEDYKQNLIRENIDPSRIHVVGNTIVEPCKKFKFTEPKRQDMILMDIHRPENFNDAERLEKIIKFGNSCMERYKLPVKLLYFKRLVDSIECNQINIGSIEMIDLMPYEEYIKTVYHSKFLISDSGTGQEEPALFGTKVIVPRDFTERPQSYAANCSFQLKLGENEDDVFNWIDSDVVMNTDWLGDGKTSEFVKDKIIEYLNG